MMEPGRTYTTTIGGIEHTGRKELFLRKRGPEEILSSRLSSGCGDYAFAFYHLMRVRGLDTVLLDGAEMTMTSLIKLQSNHTGVAVHDQKQDRWILVDPTSRRIISDHWDMRKRTYQSVYFVTFTGSLEEYRARVTDWDSLTRMHEEALAQAPAKTAEARTRRARFRRRQLNAGRRWGTESENKAVPGQRVDGHRQGRPANRIAPGAQSTSSTRKGWRRCDFKNGAIRRWRVGLSRRC